MLVYDLIIKTSIQYPKNIYIAYEQNYLTYEDFICQTNKVASFLINLNILRGDRVVISLENRPETLILFFATVAIGAIAVPISPTLPLSKLEYILKNCEPKIFCGNKSLNILLRLKTFGSIQHIICINNLSMKYFPSSITSFIFQEIIASNNRILTPPLFVDLDPAMIIYTSGSTGLPKGVVCSHLNIISATKSIVSYLNLSPTDKVINFQPFFFDYGLYQAFLTGCLGATLYLERSFIYPIDILENIKKEEITVIPFVPTNLLTIFNQTEEIQCTLNNVRIITSTGSPFPIRLLSKIQELFPNAKIFSMYGITECKRVSYLPPEKIHLKPKSVGIPMPNVEVWVVDKEGHRLSPNMVGELVVRGSNVTLGYWNDYDSTQKTYRVQMNGERWLYTGDFFTIDNEGYLYFIGRKDDLIKVGSYRVSIKEIESTLAKYEKVQEIAVIPIPDEQLGNSTKIFIIPKPGYYLTKNEIKVFCIKNFENSTLVPKEIQIVSNLPRTDTGKVDYKKLCEL